MIVALVAAHVAAAAADHKHRACGKGGDENLGDDVSAGGKIAPPKPSPPLAGA